MRIVKHTAPSALYKTEAIEAFAQRREQEIEVAMDGKVMLLSGKTELAKHLGGYDLFVRRKNQIGEFRWRRVRKLAGSGYGSDEPYPFDSRKQALAVAEKWAI